MIKIRSDSSSSPIGSPGGLSTITTTIIMIIVVVAIIVSIGVIAVLTIVHSVCMDMCLIILNNVTGIPALLCATLGIRSPPCTDEFTFSFLRSFCTRKRDGSHTR